MIEDLFIRFLDLVERHQLFLAFLALVYVVVLLARWLNRRARLREFAARHGLRFRGILPSDKYAPYTGFGMVRSAVLLYHVMEGRWNDSDVALFDYPRRGGTCTGVIVSVPNDSSCFQVGPPAMRAAVARRQRNSERVTLDDPALASWVVVTEAIPGSAAAAIGRRTAALLASGPPVFLETYVGYLFVGPLRQLAPDDLPEFLGFVSSVARALDADAHKRSSLEDGILK